MLRSALLTLLVVTAAGPGDPPTVTAVNLSQTRRMAAVPGGAFALIADAGATVRYVAPSGTVSMAVPPGTVLASDVAADGFGGLLLIAQVYNASPPEGLWRHTTELGYRLVYPMPTNAAHVATAPNGDIWVTRCLPARCGWLLRLDPLGKPLDSVFVGTLPEWMAVSPTGVLHWQHSGGVYRLQAGAPEFLFDPPGAPGALAFDVDGYLYIARSDAVALYDPAYQLVSDTFATQQLSGNTNLAFTAAADGAATARLFTISGNAIHEFNPAGIRAPGARVIPNTFGVARTATTGPVMGTPFRDSLSATDGTAVTAWHVVQGTPPPGLTLDSTTGLVRGVPTSLGTYDWAVRGTGNGRIGIRFLSQTVTAPSVNVDDVARALFGVTSVLSPHHARYLDLAGNANGALDLGDLRAHLRRQGRIP